VSKDSREKDVRSGPDILNDYLSGEQLKSRAEFAFIRKLRKECPWLFINYRTGSSSGRIRRNY